MRHTPRRERLRLESRRIEAMLRAALGVIAENQATPVVEAPKVEAAPAEAVQPAEPVVVPPVKAEAPTPPILVLPPMPEVADPPLPRAPVDGLRSRRLRSKRCSRRRPKTIFPAGRSSAKTPPSSRAPISVIEPDAMHHSPDHDSGEDHDHPGRLTVGTGARADFRQGIQRLRLGGSSGTVELQKPERLDQARVLRRVRCNNRRASLDATTRRGSSRLPCPRKRDWQTRR